MTVENYHLYTQADYTEQRWKNGRGTTIELVKELSSDESPDKSSANDSFDWRLSMATLAQDGDYSNFAGIDRTQVMLKGSEVQLEIIANSVAPKNISLAPLNYIAFSGEDIVKCHLPNADSATMFNVMSDNQFGSHRVEVVSSEVFDKVDVSCDILLIFVANGALSFTMNGDTCRLEPNQLLQIKANNSRQISVKESENLHCDLILVKLFQR